MDKHIIRNLTTCQTNHAEPQSSTDIPNPSVEVRSTGSSETSHVTTDQEIPAKIPKTGSFDIGDFLDNEAKASNFQKRFILTTNWTPSSANFVWPSSSKNNQGKLSKRSLMQSHIDRYPQFVYSENLKGFFCKICVFFQD